MQVFVGKDHLDVARVGNGVALVVLERQHLHQRIPLQPASFKELAHGRGCLQAQACDFFRPLEVVAREKGVLIQRAAKLGDGLAILLRKFSQLQIDVGVALAVRVAHAVEQIGKQLVSVAQLHGRFIEEATGVCGTGVDANLDIFLAEPLGQHRVWLAVVDLRGRIQFARHRGRRSRRGRGRSGSSSSSSRCDHLLGLQRLVVARDAGQALYQFFDKKYRAIDRARAGAAPAGRLGVYGGLRIFADEAALVATVDGHGWRPLCFCCCIKKIAARADGIRVSGLNDPEILI